MTKDAMEFPPSFIFGTATHSPGSEGVFEGSDWRIWERSGKAPASGDGNGGRDLFEEDFARLSELGLTHRRLTIDWSRIEPQRGVYNRDAIENYRRVLESCKRRGMTAWVGLHHFVLPAWFARAGGFTDEASVMYWHRYVELVARELGTEADFWIPMDQPNYYALASNLLGRLPPGRKRMDKAGEAMAGVFRAAGDAYHILKKYLPARARVGFNILAVPVEAADPQNDADRMAVEFVDNYLNAIALTLVKEGAVNIPGRGGLDLPSVKGAADFVGVDFMSRLVVSKKPAPDGASRIEEAAGIEGMPGIMTAREGEPLSETGAGMKPEAVQDALRIVHRSGLELPVYITASGVATLDEGLRVGYVGKTLETLHRVIEQGQDLRGFFYFSDVDLYNFDRGFGLHYGLAGFDPETKKRSPRPASDFYSRIATSRKLEKGSYHFPVV